MKGRKVVKTTAAIWAISQMLKLMIKVAVSMIFIVQIIKKIKNSAIFEKI